MVYSKTSNSFTFFPEYNLNLRDVAPRRHSKWLFSPLGRITAVASAVLRIPTECWLLRSLPGSSLRSVPAEGGLALLTPGACRTILGKAAPIKTEAGFTGMRAEEPAQGSQIHRQPKVSDLLQSRYCSAPMTAAHSEQLRFLSVYMISPVSLANGLNSASSPVSLVFCAFGVQLPCLNEATAMSVQCWFLLKGQLSLNFGAFKQALQYSL